MKITLTIDAKTESAMMDLASMTGLSHVENIQRGLALLQFVTEQERAGKTVLLKDRSGALEQVALRPLVSA